MISWTTRYRLRLFFRTSMWMIPILCTLLAILAAPFIRWIDAVTRPVLFGFDLEGARSLLVAFVAASISYIVFLASALLIAVQLMSASLSPRVIREFMNCSFSFHDDGSKRLYVTRPRRQDFVSLAISEIRLYGSGSLQVCRRLEAMLNNLVDMLPQHRSPALIKELELLRSGAERSFPDAEDLLRAVTPDALGLGGGPHW